MNNNGIPIYYIYISRQSKNKTISNYIISHVFEFLLHSLLSNKTNESLYWLSELMCSGQTDKLWIFIFEFYSMYIHIFYGNFISYIYSKYKEYIIIKKNHKPNVLHNNIKLREYLFRIIYILSVLQKKYVIQLFSKNLFQSFKSLHKRHQYLVHTGTLLSNITTQNAKEIFSLVTNDERIEIDNALSQLKLAVAEFVRQYHDKNDKTKYIVYHWLSFLLEKGTANYALYQDSENPKDIQLKHCSEPPKNTYFLWIIWNILLEQYKKFPSNNEIVSLYRIYETYKDIQSSNAYMMIIVAYVLAMEKVTPTNITIKKTIYEESKNYFYNTFWFIKQAMEQGITRRDRM